MDTFKIGYFVGSLSSTSINRVLSKALISVAPPELEFHEIAIKDLPSTARTTTPISLRQARN
jgi:chromate reductase